MKKLLMEFVENTPYIKTEKLENLIENIDTIITPSDLQIMSDLGMKFGKTNSGLGKAGADGASDLSGQGIVTGA